MTPARRARRKCYAVACLAALLTACTTAASRANNLVICADLADADLTRASFQYDADGRLTYFDIVTPDALWAAPGQPETPRFPAGQSDVSPNLVDHPGVRIDTVIDASGTLRMIDFFSRTPHALALEDLRGSLALHETFHDQRAIGSLYITSRGSPALVTAVACRRFTSAAK